MHPYPAGAQGQAAVLGSKVQPMNRLASNLEDLTRAIDSMDRNMARLLNIAVQLGYYHPEPAPPTTAIEGRPDNLHNAIKLLESRVEALSGFLNVFD